MMQKPFFCLLLLLFLLSCNKSENRETTLLFVDDQIQLHDLVQSEDYLYCVGGDLWQKSMVFQLNLITEELVSFEMDSPSLLAVEADNDKIFTVGLSNRKYIFKDNEWNEIQLDSSFIRRGLCRLDNKSVIVGGQAFFQGYIENLNSSNELTSIMQVPHQLNDLEKFDNNELIAVGYGAIYSSLDSGNSWELLNVEGDFFQSTHYAPELNSIFIIGQSGLTYHVNPGPVLTKISSGKGLANNYRDILFYEQKLVRIGDDGLVEISDLDNIDWSRIDVNTNSNLLAIEEHDGTLYILTEKGELFELII